MFKKEDFSELRFSEELMNLRDLSKCVEQCRQALQEEGLPADMKTLMQITPEGALWPYLQDCMDVYLSKTEFVPTAEKERIKEVYVGIKSRLQKHIDRADTAIRSGVPLNPDGTVNNKQLEAAARKKATRIFDIEALTAYFNEVEKVRAALESLKEYQKKNGIPDFTKPEMMGEMWIKGKIFQCIEDGANFQDIIGNHFIKTN